MRLCTSDVTPVITRPGLETGRCQMVATVSADTISPALLYNCQLAHRALYIIYRDTWALRMALRVFR